MGKTLLTFHRWQMSQTKRKRAEERKQVLFLIADGIMLLWEKSCLGEGLRSSSFPVEETVVITSRLMGKPKG